MKRADPPSRHTHIRTPDITVSHTPVGRETLAAITEELLEAPVESARGPAESSVNVRPDDEELGRWESAELEIFEMVTFVVKGEAVEQLASNEARRAFVLQRLAHRLPSTQAEDIERIDVTPWTARGSVVVRVWCRVATPSHAGSQ